MVTMNMAAPLPLGFKPVKICEYFIALVSGSDHEGHGKERSRGIGQKKTANGHLHNAGHKKYFRS